jgi:hypothetical protein
MMPAAAGARDRGIQSPDIRAGNENPVAAGTSSEEEADGGRYHAP